MATLAVAGAVGATFYTFLDSSRQEILARSDMLREAAARRVDERVTAELKIPLGALGDVERGLRLGALHGDDPDRVEARLFTELVDHPSLAALSFTHADLQGFDDQKARIGPDDRWQVAAFRQVGGIRQRDRHVPDYSRTGSSSRRNAIGRGTGAPVRALRAWPRGRRFPRRTRRS